MKNILQALALAIITFLCADISAQGDVTSNYGAYPPQFQVVTKCLDSSTLGTNFITFYEIHTLRPGATTSIASFRASGASFTPPAGTLYVGACPSTGGGSGGSDDTIRDIELINMCDVAAGETSSTPFVRAVMRSYKPSTGSGSTVILANYIFSGATYTPTGTVIFGPCSNQATPAFTHTNLVNTTATYPGTWESWSVTNTGFTVGTVSINSGASIELLPGERINCTTHYDNISNKTIPCASLAVDVTGSSGKVILKKK